jgi:hypothetical protein
MEQVQLDPTEINEHLGIRPRDGNTAQELEDLHTLKSGSND